ncbi:uncharacterized protein LOC34624527 [Cyclospora cayetanensis]|uniref:Uncharacterized protein LOC34624527 n=1 Tax=Cyclospora cayetanensis TaxID=88456 RepID=A0A6P6RS77_9EIME|nr:uncharacterized protein LOC34624527 [Cyclospora cayetanensis]
MSLFSLEGAPWGPYSYAGAPRLSPCDQATASGTAPWPSPARSLRKPAPKAPLATLLSTVGALHSGNRGWGRGPLRSLDLPEALRHRHLSQPMHWGLHSHRFAAALLSTVYTANTDSTCAPICEPQALWPPDEHAMQPQPHLLQHMLVDRRDSRASDPASFARSLRVSEAPSQEGGMAPVVPLSPRGGGGTRGALPPSRTGEVPGAPPPSQATASTEGSRNVSCVQFATVNEAVLALGFESGALEFWLLPLPPGEGPPQEGEGAPQEGACTPACRCVADTSSEPPDGAALGSAEEDHSSLLKALHTLHEQKQHLQQQQSQQHLCSTWEGALRGSPEVTALAWHPHELLLAAAYADGRIALWKLETQELSMNSPASPTAGGDAGEACVTVHRMHTFLFACPVPEPSASVQEVLGAPWTDAEGPSPAAAADVLLHSPTSLVWGPEGECLVVGSREGALLLWSLGALRQYQRAAALLEAGGGAPLRGPSGRRLMVPPSGNPAFLLKKDAFSSAEKVAALSSEGSLSLHDSVPRIRGGSSLKTLSNASTQPSSASPPDTPVGRDAGLTTPGPQQQQPQQKQQQQQQCKTQEKIPSAVGEDPPPWGSPSATAPVPQICEPFEGTGSTQWLAPPTEPDDSRCLRDAHSRLLQRFLPHFGGPRVQLHVPEETPSCPLRRRHPESSAARGPSISGVWLLGISSVIREAHGGKVRCLSFCVHDSRVLLSAGDTAAGAAGSRGLLLPMPACGSSKLKLWFQDSEAIQPFPILEIFLEGLVSHVNAVEQTYWGVAARAQLEEALRSVLCAACRGP